MRRAHLLVGVAVAGLAVSTWFGGFAVAQPAAPSAANAATPRGLGGQLATQGAPGVAACSGCHGAQGEGNPAAGFPRLSGQPSEYLLRQLDAYANDTRRNPIMQPIAKAMNADQRAAAASFYAELPMARAGAKGRGAPAAAGPANAAASAPDALAVRLSSAGDDGRSIQACSNCHGAQGAGEWPYPYLAGQHASYLTAALGEWKDGSRNTDPSGQMQRIASALSPDDISALAAYFGGLSAPLAVARMADAAPTRARRAKTVVSGPTTSATPAAQGVGSEQGSPIGGGGQSNSSTPDPNGPSGAQQPATPSPAASTPSRRNR